jgi:soluble lytic murein transglycosylase-like protein
MIRLGMFVAAFCAFMLIAIPASAANSASPAAEGEQFAQLERMLNGTADDLLKRASQPLPVATASASAQTRAAQTTDPVRPLQPAALSSAVERVQRLRPLIEPILRQEGVPPELSAIVLIESGGEPTALSPKGARGLWQLMPDTARRYGLVVSRVRDDRLDVLKSTHAAARYLRDLRARFGNWSAAPAAYNAGEQVVNDVLRRSGGSDFQSISRHLPNETRNYVPAVLAAMRGFGGSAKDAPSVSTRGRVAFATFVAGN